MKKITIMAFALFFATSAMAAATSDSTHLTILENGTQSLMAGDSIKPVQLEYTNMPGDPVIVSTLAGTFASRNDIDHRKLTLMGLVNEKVGDGTYTISIVAKGPLNNDTATVTITIKHKPMVTSIKLVGGEDTQSVVAGDSIKPVVFKIENAKVVRPSGFPGGGSIIIDQEASTATLVGKVNKTVKGDRVVKVYAEGLDNTDSATVTIKVSPLPMVLELVSGSDNQTVVAGESIEPIIYGFESLSTIDVEGLPDGIDYDFVSGQNQFKIYGTVDPKAEIKEYAYTLKASDEDSETITVTGKFNVVKTLSSSSGSGQSSSSVGQSSSGTGTSSSSTDKSSSSGNGGDTNSSSSAKSSSSSTTSSDSSNKSSDSSKNSSSSGAEDAIVASAVRGFALGFANNELTVVLPKSSMVRVQVFDMMGHMVESFSESVGTFTSFSLAHLERGSYVVRVESDRMVRSAKIVVK
ncbi:T9SS type A sorting domain-containing protein [Fibrobacter sp. UBA4309]|uniref:T9SS type A sorting domain-containing protein n=1 Tax=Fibrobacter sp. UBA4309 TaxID=1946537 RepID=UPI0025BC2EF0|nr:T9SS type A sorting domain-containing protein [Fibrobacter sp. UBA4309]